MRKCASSLESELSPNELELLISTIKNNSFPGRHLEIGTAAGGTLWRMVQATGKSNRRPLFVVVDPMTYFRDQLGTIKKNLATHGINPQSVDFRVTSSNKC